MAIPQKIIKFLEKEKIKYEPIEHRIVYTAYDKAITLRVSPKIIGKTLILKTDKDFAFVLVPANKNLDKLKFKKLINNWRRKTNQKPIKNIDFVSESWMKKNLKGIKLGSVPPLGNLFGFPTFVDNSLMKSSKIIINGGDHNWSIKITPAVLKKTTPDLIMDNFCKARK